MIAHHFTDSGFAFVLLTADEPGYSNADDQDREPVVWIYDLERLEVPLPGVPEISGRPLCCYYRDSLINFANLGEDLRVPDGLRELFIPVECVRDVAHFLTEW